MRLRPENGSNKTVWGHGTVELVDKGERYRDDEASAGEARSTDHRRRWRIGRPSTRAIESA
jgi:hypothetical protein